MFKKILVANRGEIAVRVIRACRELDITSCAIYSEPDKLGRHVSLACEAYQLEGQPARVYLDYEQIIAVAKRAGAEAVHPGYGFLAENADFAQACAQAGLVFIGPKPDVIRSMGSKVASRKLMESAGVPVVPGTIEPVSDVETVKALANKYGYPIAIKASAGGGGRGLRVVRKDDEVEQALAGAQREGQSYFGDSQVYVEKYLDHPRHIEVQILADNFGNVVHLFERDCSTQRRHQKLVEECPAANLDAGVRKRLLEAAVRGAKSIGYTSAGTIECLVAGSDFYFLEVNTRVQVEHPITELTTGVDIVKEQILIAFGQPLSFTQDEVSPRGHAIECRINAEEPAKNFMPSPGTITGYSEPHMPWVRVDSACYNGYQVLPFYDSLLAKLVVWGRTRDEAVARMKVALKDYKIEGVATTISFHLLMLDDPVFKAGGVYTTYVESELKASVMALPTAAKPAQVTSPAGGGGTTAGAGAPAPDMVRSASRTFEVDVNERQFKVMVSELVDASNPRGQKTPSQKAGRPAAAVQARPASQSGGEGNHTGEVRASMHGTVKQLFVQEGDRVETGQRVLVFEAMKMESDVMASKTGKVTSIKVKAGETVESEALMVLIGD